MRYSEYHNLIMEMNKGRDIPVYTTYKGRNVAIEEWADLNKRKGIGRNDKCFCGSGKKYKKCCINKERK